MAVQHSDVRNLRAQNTIPTIWSPTVLTGRVSDDFPHQTVANYSSCPCGQEHGFHCREVNHSSCRFIRLGEANYCLPEESPNPCPIHGEPSIVIGNPYVFQFGIGEPTPVVPNGTLPIDASVTSEPEKLSVALTWQRFFLFSEAVDASASDPTIYMQCSRSGLVLRIGKAGDGLGIRYNEGYQSPLNAAMWESGNAIFITKCDKNKLRSIEMQLIASIQPILNKRDITTPLSSNIMIEHQNIKVTQNRVVWYVDEDFS